MHVSEKNLSPHAFLDGEQCIRGFLDRIMMRTRWREYGRDHLCGLGD